MNGNNRNFLITIALSVLILTLWQVFYMNPRMEAQKRTAQIEAQQKAASNPAKTGEGASPQGATGDTPSPAAGTPSSRSNVPGTDAAVAGKAGLDRGAALGGTARVKIDTPRLGGSINLKGARIDDLLLKDYHVTVDDTSPNIHLLNPSGMQDGYYVEVGYVGDDATGAVPGPDTVWEAPANAVLTPKSPVTLTYTNDKGLTFSRTLSVDDRYMFSFSDTVQNKTGASVSLMDYGRTTRFSKPDTRSTYILHEGPIGVTGEDGLQEVKYSTIEDEHQVKPGKSTDGWLGITDKYWAVALVPRGGKAFQPRFSYFDDGRTRYQSDFLSDPVTVNDGQTVKFENLVFAGAKEVDLLNRYEDQDHIRQFDLLIDWGWFYFITKPMFHLMDWLYKLLGNFGLAILATTVIVKAVFFPLANKSYKSMARMKNLQPQLTELRAKYADDKMKQQQAMMEIYKKEKINPVAGCWPMLLQIPVFFSLYKVLYVTIEMRHAPFFGWIQDLASPDPTSVFNLFGLLPYHVPGALMIGVWPLIMGVTMFLQMRMNPTPPDPTQAMIFTWMPVVFTFMLARFPAGLVIYWAWNNSLSVIQQGVIMKRQGTKIELWDNLVGLFKRKKKPSPAE